jgi:hypothetical protein
MSAEVGESYEQATELGALMVRLNHALCMDPPRPI